MRGVDLVGRGAWRDRDRVAVVEGGQSMTYREVDVMANRIVNVPVGVGYSRGSRIGLLLNNEIWSSPIDFACLKSGVARVPLNSRLSQAEQAKMPTETGVRLLIHGAALTERALALADELHGLPLPGLGEPQRAQDRNLFTEAERARPTDPLVPVEPD